MISRPKSRLPMLLLAAILLFPQIARAQYFDFFGFPDIQVVPQGRGNQQSSAAGKVDFIYNALFDYHLDNLEYTNHKRKVIVPSQTMHSVRLTPEFGIKVAQNQNLTHKIKIGADFVKDMGDHEWQKTALREMTLYYQIDARMRRASIQALAGVIPRRFAEGDYGKAFLSDSTRFYDNNLEGFLVKSSMKNFYGEVGLDWNGEYSLKSRERITAYSYMEYRPASWFRVALAADYIHLGGSSQVRGVVDNGLLNPFVVFDLDDRVWFDEFSVKAGLLQSVQNDRARVDKFIFPLAAEVTTDMRKYRVGIENTFTYGDNIMPYFNVIDAAGAMYGSRVYVGAPYYQMTTDPLVRKTPRLYDRLEIYYRPHISDMIEFGISSVIHFVDRSVLPQQTISLKFNLDRATGTKEGQRRPPVSSSSGQNKSRRTPPKGLQML